LAFFEWKNNNTQGVTMIACRVYKPAFAAFLFCICMASAAIASNGGVNKELFDCVTESGSGSSTALPLPDSLPLVDYEKALYAWILDRKYAGLGWCHDKEVRDTGPFVDGQYHGTHPAVLIYYSPEMMQWLLDRVHGVESEIPDGAMIIKEMYGAPAQIYRDIQRIKGDKQYEALCLQQLSDWTVMVKDSKASHDGWFWVIGRASSPGPAQACVLPRIDCAVSMPARIDRAMLLYQNCPERPIERMFSYWSSSCQIRASFSR
jgi:hypothetical protein